MYVGKEEKLRATYGIGNCGVKGWTFLSSGR